MRLDNEHVRKLAEAFGTEENGDRFVKVDIQFMLAAMGRLNLWERGLLQQRVVQAAVALRRTPDQRILLALFAAQELQDDAVVLSDAEHAAADAAATATLASLLDGALAIEETQTNG